MKKFIATVALGAFVFPSTFVTSSFAAEKNATEIEKAPAATAEATAETTATSAAAAGITGMAVVGIVAATAIIAATVIASETGDNPPAAHGHGHGL